MTAQKKGTVALQEFAGTYEDLSPAQKKLIDEWYAEYNQLTHDSSRPTEYNQFSQWRIVKRLSIAREQCSLQAERLL